MKEETLLTPRSCVKNTIFDSQETAEVKAKPFHYTLGDVMRADLTTQEIAEIKRGRRAQHNRRINFKGFHSMRSLNENGISIGFHFGPAKQEKPQAAFRRQTERRKNRES